MLADIAYPHHWSLEYRPGLRGIYYTPIHYTLTYYILIYTVNCRTALETNAYGQSY